jgi:glycine/D-amino acid oxidase-like deaminating enzyme
MHQVRQLPNDDYGCGWVALLPPLPPPRRLTGSPRADCVVLGAGFTGLATARQLATHRRDWRVIVLEAQRVGCGASGRNSGFIVDVGHYERARGVEGNRRLVRLGRAGRDHLRELVQAHGIECAWSARGRLHGALGELGMRQLERFRAGLDAMGEPCEPLDAAAVTAITGTSHYRGGVRTPGAVMVQPAALARGLAASLPANVELFEESPVHGIHRGTRWSVETKDGALVTDRLFLAANGFTAALGFLRRQIVPMFTFASLSRVLSDAEQAALGGEREWGLVPEERMGTTVRRTHDQRILIRNTVQYAAGMRVSAARLRAVRAIHHAAFAARFPMLPSVDLEYTWGGIMGISLNGAHYFGQLGDNLFAAGGYNGVGVALGTISGKLLADLAVDADSALLHDMRALPGPARVPPQPLLGIGVRLTLARLRARTRSEL